MPSSSVHPLKERYTGFATARVVEGELGRAAARRVVRHADLDFVVPGEDIELGEGDAIEAVHPRGVLQRREIEPPRAAWPAGDRPELVAHLPKTFAHGVVSSVGTVRRPRACSTLSTRPMTASIRVGPTPVPVQAPPEVAEDDVTYG